METGISLSRGLKCHEKEFGRTSTSGIKIMEIRLTLPSEPTKNENKRNT
jgi:hypothetical protein